MFKFRKIKSAVAVFMPVLILLTGLGSIGYAAADGNQQKHETVYAYLDHDGSVLKQSVVNRINYSGLNRIEDYGEYTTIKALNLKQLPNISRPRVIWNVPQSEPGVLIYEGVTEKELPVQVTISYLLNGRMVKGEELAGKEGKVTIKIKLKNRLAEIKKIQYKEAGGNISYKNEELYVPLMVQITVPVDLKRFHSVEPKDGAIKVVSGETMNVSFGIFPFPDEELSLELEGKDIALEPITFAVIPMMPTVPEVEMEEDLEELYKGIQSLNKALTELEEMKDSLDEVDELVDGVGELNRGGKKLAGNSWDLLKGLRKYTGGVDEISGGIGEIAGGLSQLDEGCWQLYGGISEIPDGVDNLAHGINSIAEASGGVSAGLAVLKGENEKAIDCINRLGALLQQLPAESLPPELQQVFQDWPLLVEALYTQKTILEGAEGIGPGLIKGAAQLQGGLAGLSAGIPELTAGLNELPSAIKQIAENTTKLTAGTVELHDGSKKLALSSNDLYRGVAAYLDGVDELSGGINKLNDGIQEMDREVGRLKDMNMVDTEGKSLDDLEYSLQDAIEELRLGKSTTDQMKILAERYVSFMDNQHNKDSSVQFIMKTKTIENKQLTTPTKGDIAKPKKSFWQKLKELFKSPPRGR